MATKERVKIGLYNSVYRVLKYDDEGRAFARINSCKVYLRETAGGYYQTVPSYQATKIEKENDHG